MDGTHTRDLLTSVLPDSFIETRAEEVGAVERQRKVDIVTLVWTMILGWSSAATPSIATLHRAYMWAAGHRIARSSFYERLSDQMLALMRSCLEGLLAKAAKQTCSYHGQTLRDFKKVLAIDSTVVRLHRMLRSVYPGCSEGVASAKLDIVMNITDSSPQRLKIAEGRRSDQTFWKRIGSWVEGTLLLFDLGYYNFNFLRRIDLKGGRFLCRLKSDANPTIVANHLTTRGNAIDLEGKNLQDVLGRLKRKMLDVTVALTVKKQRYRGVRSTTTCYFRVVGRRNDETGDYHLYLTNIPVDVLEADDVAETYRLRWQVELLIKQLRSYTQLGAMPTSKESVAKMLIYASFIALLLSREFLREMRSRDPGGFYPPLRFQSVFESFAQPILQAVTAHRRRGDMSIFECLTHEARDPNLVRTRGRDILYRL
jgi:hypothetical protein